MSKYVIEKKVHHHVLEWVATIFSISGALLVSLHYLSGYYVWITANILWLIFAFKYKHYGLLTLAIAYLIINCIGIIRWQIIG